MTFHFIICFPSYIFSWISFRYWKGVFIIISYKSSDNSFGYYYFISLLYLLLVLLHVTYYLHCLVYVLVYDWLTWIESNQITQHWWVWDSLRNNPMGVVAHFLWRRWINCLCVAPSVRHFYFLSDETMNYIALSWISLVHAERFRNVW